MSNPIQSVLDALVSQIESTWDDVNLIYYGIDAATVNWNNLVDTVLKPAQQAGKKAPYVVIQIGAATPDLTWGLDNLVQNLPIYIWRIDTKAEDYSTLIQKTYDLNYVLLNTKYDDFLIPNETTVDVSEGNSANTVFFASDVPMYASMIGFSALCGVQANT